ncbi:MAG: hypothetical protein PHH13_03590 [Candidatus Peribacteraceae bacterium]|nr:hypothetical protein [Candidatus Peribacteraceae bacterium]
MKKEDAVGERSLTMSLELTGRIIDGHNAGLLEFLGRSLDYSRWGYRLFAALPLPTAFSQREKQDAAHEVWKQRGSRWQPRLEARDTDYSLGIAKLQEKKPRGIALMYASEGVIRILAIVIPSNESCFDSRTIVGILIDAILDYARKANYRRVVCQCAFQPEIRTILNDRSFRAAGDNMERSF